MQARPEFGFFCKEHQLPNYERVGKDGNAFTPASNGVDQPTNAAVDGSCHRENQLPLMIAIRREQLSSERSRYIVTGALNPWRTGSKSGSVRMRAICSGPDTPEETYCRRVRKASVRFPSATSADANAMGSIWLGSRTRSMR